MKKVIVTTTINPPTPEIRKYDAMPDWDLIVIGDCKTPEYKLDRGRFMSVHEVDKKYRALCNLIGFNNTQLGRMVGFLEAANEGADIVATIDDDCMPYEGWPGPIYLDELITAIRYYCTDIVFDSLYGAFDYPSRGYPPQLYPNNKYTRYMIEGAKTIKPLVQENLWDGQADIDATWRITGNLEQGLCGVSVPYFSNAPFSPINTQNTLISGKVLKDHCGEIPFVGHVSDIWAGYLFQAYHPGTTLYAPATVLHSQKRSYESIVKDLEEEIYSYKNTLPYLEMLKHHGPDDIHKNMALPRDSIEAIKLYRSYFG